MSARLRQLGKRYTEMNAKELAAATKEFNAEFVIDTFGPPPAEAKTRLDSARKRGRPRKGAGAKVISVSVEKGMLDRCDALARRLSISRAALIGRGIRAVLAAAGEDAPPS